MNQGCSVWSVQDLLVYVKRLQQSTCSISDAFASLSLSSPLWSSKQPSWLQFNQSLVSSTTWQVNEASFRGGSLPNNQLSIKIERDDTPNNTRTHTLSSLSLSVCPHELNSVLFLVSCFRPTTNTFIQCICMRLVQLHNASNKFCSLCQCSYAKTHQNVCPFFPLLLLIRGRFYYRKNIWLNKILGPCRQDESYIIGWLPRGEIPGIFHI